MDVESKVREQAIKNILEEMKSRSPTIWCGQLGLHDEEWESKASTYPPKQIILAEDLAKDKQKKHAIEDMLPHLPPDYQYVVLKAKGLQRVRGHLEEGMAQEYWDTLDPGVLPMIAFMADGLGDPGSGMRQGEIQPALLEDPELVMIALPGIEGARVIRCELTDEETGRKEECLLLAHLGLEDLLKSVRKRYYRETFHLKEWRTRRITRKYVPYVRCYGLFKSLGLSKARLKKVRRQLWLQYWDEYQERYGERYGEERDRERRAFNREVERHSDRWAEYFQAWSEEDRREYLEEWADEEGDWDAAHLWYV